jgi:integrase/recombinase XerD
MRSRPATVSRKRSALRRFFGFLTAEGIGPTIPVLLIAGVKPGRPLPKTLTVQDVDRLFAASTPIWPRGRDPSASG